MYAHPAFVRGRPEILAQLRKCTSATERKQASDYSKQSLYEQPTSHSMLGFMLVKSQNNVSSNLENAIQSLPTRIAPPSPNNVPYHPSHASINVSTKQIAQEQSSSGALTREYFESMHCQKQNTPEKSVKVEVTLPIIQNDNKVPQYEPSKSDNGYHRGDKLALLAIALASMAECDSLENCWSMKNVQHATLSSYP